MMTRRLAACLAMSALFLLWATTDVFAAEQNANASLAQKQPLKKLTRIEDEEGRLALIARRLDTSTRARLFPAATAEHAALIPAQTTHLTFIPGNFDDFAWLKRLKNLRYVWVLPSGDKADEELAWAAILKGITRLKLDRMNADAVLSKWGDIHSLTQVILVSCQVSDITLKQLAKSSSLADLDISHGKLTLTATGLTALSRVKSLRKLSLRYTKLDREMVSSVAWPSDVTVLVPPRPAQ